MSYGCFYIPYGLHSQKFLHKKRKKGIYISTLYFYSLIEVYMCYVLKYINDNMHNFLTCVVTSYNNRPTYIWTVSGWLSG